MVAVVEGITTKDINPLDFADRTTVIDELTAMLNSLQHEVAKLMKGKKTFTASTIIYFGSYFEHDSDFNFIDFTVKSNSINAYAVNMHDDTSWILQTSATDHMSSNKSLFISFQCMHKYVSAPFLDGTAV